MAGCSREALGFRDLMVLFVSGEELSAGEHKDSSLVKKPLKLLAVSGVTHLFWA
ncbi:hypothetical protein IAD21_00709 [Abditibacteriota bacterium]|nr:hypothetical protein IAD21_00709 [Abditibacteriota bacterium]